VVLIGVCLAGQLFTFTCGILFVNQVIFRIVEDHPRDVSQDMNISIVFGDESLPRLYENSRISSDQLPAQPGKNIFIFLLHSAF